LILRLFIDVSPWFFGVPQEPAWLKAPIMALVLDQARAGFSEKQWL